MRFEISRVLDAIEARLTLDPALARAALELAEVVRMVDLDGNHHKPATLLRLGYVLDSLGAYLAEDGVAVYVVVDRSVLSDLDFTSNERMVVRRWADDGAVEVLADPADRILSVAELLGVPVLTRRRFSEYASRYPWLPNGLLAPSPAGLRQLGDGSSPPPVPMPVLARLWHCPEPGCPGFGSPAGGQPPPQLQAAVPVCPRHRGRLADAGPQPPARVFAVRIDGAVRGRFVVREEEPVVVGRAPQPAATGTVVTLGPMLSEEAMRWVSRSHFWLELRGQALVLTETSTNGTTVHTPRGPVRLQAGEDYQLGNEDVIELHHGVELGLPSRFRGGMSQPGSVMAEAPTISMRLPD